MDISSIYIFSNTQPKSLSIKADLSERLTNEGYEIKDTLSRDTSLIICIGGDGTLLGLMHSHEFPTVPIIGINTGHLGFFQEVNPDELDELIMTIKRGEYTVQPYNIAKAVVNTREGELTFHALNEFSIKGESDHSVHLGIAINESFIENFSGDGLCIATPAGSTAYNYSLGGSIVDPRLNLLQVTPIAPMNTAAYRSLTAGILIPANDKIIVRPLDDVSRSLRILFDGEDRFFSEVESVTLILSRRKINLVRFNVTTFWEKVKEKIL